MREQGLLHGINGAKFEIFVAGLKAHQPHQRGAQAIDLDKSDFRIYNLASLLDEHSISAVCNDCGYLFQLLGQKASEDCKEPVST